MCWPYLYNFNDRVICVGCPYYSSVLLCHHSWWHCLMLAFDLPDSWLATAIIPLSWVKSAIHEWQWCSEPASCNCISDKFAASGYEQKWFVLEHCHAFIVILYYSLNSCTVVSFKELFKRPPVKNFLEEKYKKIWFRKIWVHMHLIVCKYNQYKTYLVDC